MTAKTSPTLLVQAEDDPVKVENSLLYYAALKQAKVPAEMHLFAKGGHGYGLRRTELPVTDLAASCRAVAAHPWSDEVMPTLIEKPMRDRSGGEQAEAYR